MKKSALYHALVLIPKTYRLKGAAIICLLTFNAILDFFSLATFLPLIILTINPGQLTSNALLSNAYAFSGLSDPMYFAIALTMFALTFILLKTLITNWITFQKADYAYLAANVIAEKALSQYLQVPYARFPSIDYTREINRIANLPLLFANNFIIPAGTIFAEGLITLLLVSIIAFYEIKVFLFLLAVLAPVSLLYWLKKQKLKKRSQEIKLGYPLLLKHTLQTVEGLTEIRTLKKENFFKDRFKQTFQTLGKIFSRDHTLNTGTSRTTEFVAGLCISALLMYVILTRKGPGEAMLLLTIYSGVCFRIIPSINRIFSSLMQIKTHEYVIEELGQFSEPDNFTNDRAVSSLSFSEKFELRNISYSHIDHTLVLRNASLSFRKGEKIILLGRSGSGKTTLLLIMMRLLEEQGGEIVVDGKKITAADASAVQALMGYVPQNPYLMEASIAENIAFGSSAENTDLLKIKQIVRDLDLQEWIQSLPSSLDTVIGERGIKLSGGQRQRLAIARALYHDAEILLLDEATNQLDRETELEVMRAIDKLTLLNKTIILVTHRPELWKSFDRIYEIKNGHVTSIQSEEILEK